MRNVFGNYVFVARHMSQSKIVKMQLVLMLLLAGPKPHVRRIMGIVPPNARCKSKNVRSRIALSKSIPRWVKNDGGQIPTSQKASDQSQKIASDDQIRSFKSMPHDNVI